MVQAPIGIWFELQYLDATTGEFVRFTVLFIPFLVIGLAVGFLLSLDVFGPLLRWLRSGRPTEGAPEVWTQAVRAAFVTVNRSALAIAIAIVPYVLLVAPPVLDAGAGVVLALIIFGEVILVTGWLTLQFLVDIALRPLVRDLAEHLPTDFDDPSPGWRLRSKALLTVPVAAFYGAVAAGAFILDQTSPEARFFTALAAAGGVTLAFAGPVAAIATGSILDPIQDLIAATKRVVRGDVTQPVPVLTDDEFGEVAQSFNRMQRGLLEREALRDENEQLVSELQASRARIVAASDEARRKVERDLHDGAQQNLVLLNLKLGLLDRKLEQDPAAARELVAESRRDLDRALTELRDLAHGIYPQTLVSDGLPGALAELAENSPIPASFNPNGAGRYPAELEAAVYFCCLEALQNAAKHAGAGARAKLLLEQREGGLHFEVNDNGVGFAPSGRASESAGIQNMADRIGALGGELHVASQPGSGTTVAGTVPLDR